MRVITCAGGAPWEPALVRALQVRELGVEVVRRCVDAAELVGIALRERPRAAIVAAELPWLDRDLVGTLHDAGVAVVAVEAVPGLRPLERIGIAHRLDAGASAADVRELLGRLVPQPARAASSAAEALGGPGRLVAVWGGPGAPGRTTVAVHLAAELAREGQDTILVDGDAWSASIAQVLALPEVPGILHAIRLAAEGWPAPLSTCLHPHGPISVLPGLPRGDLWLEVRERAWQAVLDAARREADVVVVDLAAPVDEDEELSFDRAPYRRNLMTRAALRDADEILFVVGADPVGLRRAVFACQQLRESIPSAATHLGALLNRMPAAGRRAQEISHELERWTNLAPRALLPTEPVLAHVAWSGTVLHELAPRSAWLRELRPLARDLAAVRA